MRAGVHSSLLGAIVLASVALTVATARGDVGPPPSCGPGTHHEYLYGHHCVPNGSHLEQDSDGGIGTKTVPDPPGSRPADYQAGNGPPATRGCVCDVSTTGAASPGAFGFTALLIAVCLRRGLRRALGRRRA
jgi:hypothetical protein